MKLAYTTTMIRPRVHMNSIVAQVAPVPTFLHSLDPKRKWNLFTIIVRHDRDQDFCFGSNTHWSLTSDNTKSRHFENLQAVAMKTCDPAATGAVLFVRQMFRLVDHEIVNHINS